MQSVLNAFRGPFRYQPSSSHLWERKDDNHDVFECQSSSSSSTSSMNSTTQSIKNYSKLPLNSKYQQMDDAVQPLDGRPFIFSKNEQFKFIAVDWIRTKFYDFIEVIFIATTDGKLLKYVKWPDITESCLIDEIQLINPDENQFLSMKFWKDSESIYFGTENEFIRQSIHQCHKYLNKNDCLQSGDPYCGWNQIKMKCTRPPNNNLKDENWLQSDQQQSVCPRRWTKWFSCSETGLKSTSTTEQQQESCKCRKRPCNSNDLQQQQTNGCFDGFEYEVTNCTRNGEWSEWSNWSSCSPSCGHGRQYRQRQCNNPLPLNNGKYCQGNDREERQCDNLPYCQWTTWSEWTNCSSLSMDCNESTISKRTRQCLDFNGNAVDNDYCQGPYLETIKCECNKKSLALASSLSSASSKSIQWTDWFINDLNMNEIVEQRNEIIMIKNNELPKHEQRVVSLKYCDNCGGHLYRFKGKDFLM